LSPSIAPPPPPANRLTVTIETARQISGLGNTTLFGLIRSGRLEVVRVGRRTLITMRSLEALLTPQAAPEPEPRRRGRPRKSPTPTKQPCPR
jgi:hypothetical protein